MGFTVGIMTRIPHISHALLIGATGMLAAAAEHIATRADCVTLVARRAPAFRLDDSALDAKLTRVAADWSDETAFLRAIDAAEEAHGPFGLALVWLHPRAENLRRRLAARVTAPPRLYVEMLGSAASRPHAFGDSQLDALGARDDPVYRQVILGFVIEGARARWLTDGEISAAAIRALDTGEARTVAGQVEPWDRRP